MHEQSTEMHVAGNEDNQFILKKMMKMMVIAKQVLDMKEKMWR